MATVFSKFIRPESPRRGVFSERDLVILATILRYRFSPTSELVRLVDGNQDVTHRRLRFLWESGYVNRFAFPGIRTHSEFIYYLDQPQALQLLLEHRRIPAIHPQMEREIRLNREAGYAEASVSGQHMKLGFLHHTLMISRLHFMLEMSCRNLEGQVQLAAWQQGGELRGHKVRVPEIRSHRIDGKNEHKWEEHGRIQNVPVEPDALFSLQFRSTGTQEQLFHFCYEADRGSMPLDDMLRKLRGYDHFIRRQQKHREAFGVHRIRAVLLETTNEQRARKLMELTRHPVISGSGGRSALFWFTISPVFRKPNLPTGAKTFPQYLAQPGLVFGPCWAMSDKSMHTLIDMT